MRSLEIFSGCGGLAFGVAEAGFDHVMVIENDKNACATLAFNKEGGVLHFADWNISASDAQEVDFTRAGSVDLVSGGPPCQPFSIGGKHKGPTDKRNMWPEAIRAVRELSPKGFLFENVRGLLRPAFADYLEFIQLQLSWPDLQSSSGGWKSHLKFLRAHKATGAKPAYRVVVRGINAADYGAPQKRYRAIIMGIRSDIADDVIFPAPTHSREALIWSQRVTGDYWERHGISKRSRPQITDSDQRILDTLLSSKIAPAEKPWVTVRDAIGDLSKPSVKKEPVAGHLLHPGARIYVGHTGSLWDEPAKALKAGSHGVPGGENVIVEKNGEVRYFTIREMIRLQGLPDSFAIKESWVNAIKQLGNAVPVQVGKIFGDSLRSQIQNGLSPLPSKLPVPTKEFRKKRALAIH